MIRTGDMVRAGGSAAMKVVDISAGLAECVWIDGNGGIRRRYHEISALSPFWMSLGPKTVWPEAGNLDAVAIAEEERLAAAQRKAAKKAARGARRSRKVKRGKAA